jgi:hypothetical protein
MGALAQPVTVVADGGYANGEHIAQLDDKGITSYVAVTRALNNQGDGTLYDRTAFKYDAAGDRFSCPADKTLGRKQLSSKDKLVIYAARPQDCGACASKPQCTLAAQRFVSRHHPFARIKHRILRFAGREKRIEPGSSRLLPQAAIQDESRRLDAPRGTELKLLLPSQKEMPRFRGAFPSAGPFQTIYSACEAGLSSSNTEQELSRAATYSFSLISTP